MSSTYLRPTQTEPTTGLSDEAIEMFLNGEIHAEFLPEPKWGPIGREVYERTYSRTTEDGKKEVWAETVRRVVLGNLNYAPLHHMLPREDVELFRLIYEFKMIPAGRHLWVTGTANPFSRNCFVAPWGNTASTHFRFLASRLFEGGGVGGNYSEDLISIMPEVEGVVDISITCRDFHPDLEGVRASSGGLWVEYGDLLIDDIAPEGNILVVDDSREGWVDAWGRIIDLAHTPGAHRLILDLSEVREHGAPLKTFGGTASGPAPLAGSVLAISRILEGAKGRLTGLECMSIDHELASAIVAGGARRSARMSFMRWDDPQVFEFARCKADHMSHWTTNISVEVDQRFRDALEAGDGHAADVLHAIAVGMVENGEPGIVDTDIASVGERTGLRMSNPCGEIFIEPGECCLLGSVNLDAFGADDEGAHRAFQLLARFLYRATENPYPDPLTAEIEGRNRRLGAGIFGLQGWAAAHGVRLSDFPDSEMLISKLESFRATVRQSADMIADALDKPRSIKVTAVAPTGTIAQLPGTTPGVHPVYARYFIRRVRFAETDPALIAFAEQGYKIVDDVYAAKTKVVEFPLKDSILDRYDESLIEQADEISFMRFNEIIAAVQKSFADNAVSATGQIRQNSDVEEIKFGIRSVLGRVKGLTAFPDVSRPLSPYERLTADQYQDEIAILSGTGSILSGDSNNGDCVGGACPIR